MTLNLDAIRKDAEAAKGLPEGNWNYEPIGQTVWNGDKHMVCNIRGWGHLGKLPNGAELQDAMGRHIANLNPDTVLALLDRLEAAEKDAARYRHLFAGNKVLAQFRETYDFWDGQGGKAGFDAAIDFKMREQK